jgi:hypothetical protein
LGRHRRRQSPGESRRRAHVHRSRQEYHGLPQGALTGFNAFWVSRIDASHFDAGTAYVALDGHRSDDLRPYVLRDARLRENVPEYLRAIFRRTETSRSFAKIPRTDLLFVGRNSDSTSH